MLQDLNFSASLPKFKNHPCLTLKMNHAFINHVELLFTKIFLFYVFVLTNCKLYFLKCFLLISSPLYLLPKLHTGSELTSFIYDQKNQTQPFQISRYFIIKIFFCSHISKEKQVYIYILFNYFCKKQIFTYIIIILYLYSLNYNILYFKNKS